MNLLDVDRTDLVTAFEAVRTHAARDGVEIVKSEIVGLVPERGLPPDPETTLRLRQPVERQVLERRLEAAFGIP